MLECNKIKLTRKVLSNKHMYVGKGMGNTQIKTTTENSIIKI